MAHTKDRIAYLSRELQEADNDYHRVLAQRQSLINMVEDGALQFTRLTGDSLEVYARTWATLARAALKLAKGE